jgi:glucosamine--fructose-6-phosphate aminotransferase (isomerizing)
MSLAQDAVVIGRAADGNYVASDVSALLPVTRNFQFLEEGDVATIRRDEVVIRDHTGACVDRPVKTSELSADAVEKGEYAHYMLKEIHEQPRAIAQTLAERIAGGRLLEAAFGPTATAAFARAEAVQIVACGTSWHAGSVARYWIEQICRLPCWVDIASEFRYRNPVVPANTLFVADFSIRRNSGHACRPAAGQSVRIPVDPCDLQCSRVVIGSRIRACDVDARRSRNRRCVH